MQPYRVENLLRALVLNDKIFLKSGKELLLAHSRKILYDTVVVDNPELGLREAYGHEVVVLLIARVVWILFALFLSNSCRSGRTVVSVSNIKGIYL